MPDANHFTLPWPGDTRISFPRAAFWLFAAFSLACIFAAIGSGYYALAGLPMLAPILYLSLVDFKVLFYLLVFCLPFSTEVLLPNGLGTDLPTEPLTVGLMLVFGLYLLRNLATYPGGLWRHPLTWLLLLHLGWIFITSITSQLPLVSIKFSLAKTWYVVTFFFLAAHILRNEADFKRFFWVLYWPMMAVVVVVMGRHSTYGFTFADVYKVLHPFQRNHVNYAATLAEFFPLAVMATAWYPWRSQRWWLLVISLVVLLAAISLSYTRAAYVALLIALGVYFLIRWRLIRYALAGAVVAALAGAVYVVQDNRYLQYAPDFDRTISHQDFDNLIEATYKLEDISTMERLYRWVAGGHMAPEHPWLGWGPGNFVNFYKPYTVTGFQTYVSDNPENSGIHSYYLMTLVEQGVPGLLFLALLLGYHLVRGEQIYHRLAHQPQRQHIAMMVMLSSVVIYAFLLINDLLETDKVGAFFFINLAVLINQELAIRHTN